MWSDISVRNTVIITKIWKVSVAMDLCRGRMDIGPLFKQRKISSQIWGEVENEQELAGARGSSSQYGSWAGGKRAQHNLGPTSRE